MHRYFVYLLVAPLLSVSPLAKAAGEFLGYEELVAITQSLEAEKIYAPGELNTLFANVNRSESVLKAIARPAEATREWRDYGPTFVNDERLQKGLVFWDQYADVLERAEKKYGVPPEMILAILGVETKFGDNKGRNRVIDALATLGLDYPPRAPFFRKELREFLVLCKETGMDPLSINGSYAGAMGFPQFMPSSWRKLAVDFDEDGKIDLINNPVDAIGSIANYFHENGWKKGDIVTTRARIVNQDYDSIINNKDLNTTSTLSEIAKKGLIPRERGHYAGGTAANAIRLQGQDGGEFWLAFNNFYVITRYNRSILYAMAVYQLSESLRATRAARLAAATSVPATP